MPKTQAVVVHLQFVHYEAYFSGWKYFVRKKYFYSTIREFSGLMSTEQNCDSNTFF